MVDSWLEESCAGSIIKLIVYLRDLSVNRSLDIPTLEQPWSRGFSDRPYYFADLSSVAACFLLLGNTESFSNLKYDNSQDIKWLGLSFVK